MDEQLIFSNPHIGKEESGALKALGLEDYFISKGKEVLEKKFFLKIKHLINLIIFGRCSAAQQGRYTIWFE